MSRRTVILDTLISSISSSTASTGHRGMRFLHEINSFPAFYVHATAESRIHIGNGVRYGLLSVAIRGYQWSDNLDDIELYARTIEIAVDSFRIANRNIVQEARITSLTTDEGVMAPYGAVDISVEILYDVN